MKFTILIIDDEKLVCSSVKRIIEGDEKTVHTALNFSQAQSVLREKDVDLVLLDYKLREMDGLSVLKLIQEEYPDVMVIMLTAYATVSLAIDAMKNGAYDFIQKEEDPTFISYTVERALDSLRLKKEVEELREQCIQEIGMPDIVASSQKMKHLLDIAKEFAQTEATMLLTGETGTGKNLIAQYIHHNSQRFNERYVSINCAAIPSDLLESELFGYEKGAFTGSSKTGKRGLIEQANGGTLLLDEISELNFELQAKLLYLFENNEVYRVGGVKPIEVDVRFIAATNTNITELVDSGKFRSDLYYRLNVGYIEIPPLRERREDIIPLAKRYIEDFNLTFRKSVSGLDEEAMNYVIYMPWFGNVRELRNYIERAVLLAKGKMLTLSDLTINQGRLVASIGDKEFSTFSIQANTGLGVNLFHQVQKELIQQALNMVENNRSKAAKILGVPRTTLYHYIQKYSIG